jgi:hypothetical protein
LIMPMLQKVTEKLRAENTEMRQALTMIDGGA